MKQIAKISGVAYLMIFIGGFYANFAVLESLVDINNSTGTTINIINNHSQFGYGLLGFVVMLFFDAVLIWSLFYLTKPVSKKGSYIASTFRFLHALFFSFALFKLWQVYQLTSNSTIYKSLQGDVMTLIQDFDKIWTLGLLFFGIHLAVLGYLTMKSSIVPKTIGLLLIQAALGYLIDGVAKLTLNSYYDYQPYFEAGVLLTGVIGEFSFTIWLLLKGFRKQSLAV